MIFFSFIRIHALSLPRDKNHPAHRAILYNEDTYSKRKINDFLAVLEGFSKATEIVTMFKDHASSFRYIDNVIRVCAEYGV